MRSILIGTDGTEQSERAVERAIELAQAFRAKVLVASVAPVLTAAGHGLGGIDPVDPPEEHQVLVDTVVARVEAAGLQAEPHLGVGDPARALVEIAKESAVDLIVLGTHERNLIEHALGMSVSSSVVRHAACDVLIVR
jgi:nucleotide-binding universal stress UspA family protein